MGMSLTTHYCGGKAVKASFTIGHKDLSCGMIPTDQHQDLANKQCLKRKNCCENQFTDLSVDQNYKESSLNASEFEIKYVPYFTCSLLKYYAQEIEFKKESIGHSPPVSIQNRSILHQVFRL
jgi:hypothetical protein